jgi:hypothetical protein
VRARIVSVRVVRKSYGNATVRRFAGRHSGATEIGLDITFDGIPLILRTFDERCEPALASSQVEFRQVIVVRVGKRNRGIEVRGPSAANARYDVLILESTLRYLTGELLLESSRS